MSVDAEFVQGLIADLNELGEHERIEAKTASDMGKSVLETVCAFANEPGLGGGHLLLGVKRPGEPDLFGERRYTVVGVDDPEKVGDDLASQCGGSAFNRPVRPRITPVQLPEGTVIHVFVPENRPEDKPVYLTRFGLPRGAFRRIAATDQKGTDDDLRMLYDARPSSPYDREVVGRATRDDIDPDAIRLYRRLLGESRRSADVLEFDDDELLVALGAVEKTAGGVKPTVAGLLLFGTRLALRRDFAMMRVDYLRVPGTEWVEDSQNRYDALIEIRAPLITALFRAEAAVLDDLPKKFHLPEGSLQRQDILPLPRKVLREAIVNALMHRDYRVYGPTLIIRFTNRIEIHNPGFSLKPKDQLGKPGSEPRNPTIATVFHDTGLAETKGTGIRTMRREMEKAELAPPTFESERAGNRFIARIPLTHLLSGADLAWLDGIGEDLSAHERVVLVNARDVGRVTNESVRSMTGLDRLDASKLLGRLSSPRTDLLSMEGGGNQTFYLPTDRFLASLPEGVAVPEGRDGSSMSESGSSMSDVGSSMSRAPSSQDLPPALREAVDGIGGAAGGDRMREVIRLLCGWRPLSANELSGTLGRTADYLKTRYLKPMVASGDLALTIPDKPRSRLQKYKVPDDA